VKRHAPLGADIAAEVLSPDQVSWMRHHHERWDGGGYPAGLAGEEIPYGARLLAVADAWDAMTSARPYQSARSPEEALKECRSSVGSHLCPTAVAALGRCWRQLVDGSMEERRVASA
jgi:HD-GYP domain-containing protein (c-di-GMP phosphodiesterase class II)